MTDGIFNDRPNRVIDLGSRRHGDDTLTSITLVFGGVNYGTIPIRAPYAPGKPVALYLVPAGDSTTAAGDDLRGPLDCLITDEVALALQEAQ